MGQRNGNLNPLANGYAQVGTLGANHRRRRVLPWPSLADCPYRMTTRTGGQFPCPRFRRP